MALYPESTTRFHPTFAYEILWNVFTAGLLLTMSRKYHDKLKPGIIFGAWLILAGLGRNVIEFFRPDQPTFPGTAFSYSRLVAILMIFAGVVLILIKSKVLRLKFISSGRETYQLAPPLAERLDDQQQAKSTDIALDAESDTDLKPDL